MLQPQNPWLSHLLTLWPPHLEQSCPRHQAFCYSLFLRKPTHFSSQNISVKPHCPSLLSVCTVGVCVRAHLLHNYAWTLVNIWLSAKRCACKGLCTSAENKTLLKTVFIWNVVLCTCMNEWIYSTDNFSNQAGVDFKIQSSHTEKRQKMTTKNGHPCTEWFSSLCLQTNRKHMEKQSLICIGTVAGYWVNNLIFITLQIHWHDQGMLNWVYSWAKWYRKEENFKHSCRWYRERLAADWESTSWRDGGRAGFNC